VKLTAPGNSKDVLGVAVFNIDHTATGEYRGYIRHLSVQDMTKLQTAIE
jgi:hypothetical protein